MSPHAIISHAIIACEFSLWSSNLPGRLAVRSSIPLRAGTFGAYLTEEGSTRTGNRHACKIPYLDAHMADPAVQYGGDERKLYPLILLQAEKKRIYTYHIHFLAENKSTHIPTSILLPLGRTCFLSKIKRGFQSTYISHMLGWIDIHALDHIQTGRKRWVPARWRLWR